MDDNKSILPCKVSTGTHFVFSRCYTGYGDMYRMLKLETMCVPLNFIFWYSMKEIIFQYKKKISP